MTTRATASKGAEGAADTAAPLRHFSASLPMMLLRAREAVMVRFRAMLRENGLTEQQWRVLRALDAQEADGRQDAGRMDVSQLAQATYLLGPSLTRILRDLSAHGLVATTPDSADNRRKRVALSADGRARMTRIAPLSEAIYADIAARFGAEKLARLQALLDELRERMPDAAQTLDRNDAID